MRPGDTLEFGAGHVGRIERAKGSRFVLEFEGRFAACEGDAEEFTFADEANPWRDSAAECFAPTANHRTGR